MFYRPVNELIVSSPRDGETKVSGGRYIHHEHKKNQWGKLNYLITGEVKKNDLTKRWKDRFSHTVNDVFNYCPMVLNYLTLKGYKKILFVGHYNASQRSWTFPRKSDRQIHKTPTIKSTEETMVDPNVWVQFLPIVRMAHNYPFEMHTCKPSQWRYRELMHSLYMRYEIDLINCEKQYKHGMENFNLEQLPDTQYDAVVFAGVPKNFEDSSFSHHHIRTLFAPYCTPDFDIVDINYQDPDPDKYIQGATDTNNEWLNEVFVNRCIWDEKFRELEDEDRNIEYGLLDNMINTYSG